MTTKKKNMIEERENKDGDMERKSEERKKDGKKGGNFKFEI